MTAPSPPLARPPARAASVRDRLWLLLGSLGGLGYLPVAPGTWGTAGALAIWWLARDLSPAEGALAAAALTVVAVVVASRAEAVAGHHDASHIVIDEAAGLLWAAVGVPWRWQQVAAAFALFRLLDGLKPGPIGWIDRRVVGGLGVVLDDVVAGMVAAAALHGARWLYGGWW